MADEVTLLAQAVVLNYLALHNDVGQLGSVLPGHGLGSGGQLDALIGPTCPASTADALG